jgi:serine phosphatase RsbU (regulator of sigma subunit)
LVPKQERFPFPSLTGGSPSLVIGDVSGHGLDSGILMAQTHPLVPAAANCEPDPARILSDPARILSHPTRILSEVNALLVLFTGGVTEAEAADGTMRGTSCAG